MAIHYDCHPKSGEDHSTDCRGLHYEGAVLSTRERNGYDDSDFYAVVWDGTKLTEVEYATTRFPTYGSWAKVDATDEVKAAAGAWAAEAAREGARFRAEAEALIPAPGKRVEVTGGRKYKGIEGWVTWVGEGKCYSHRYYGCPNWCRPDPRARVETEFGSFFIDTRHLTVTGGAEPDYSRVDAIAEAARKDPVRYYLSGIARALAGAGYVLVA